MLYYKCVTQYWYQIGITGVFELFWSDSWCPFMTLWYFVRRDLIGETQNSELAFFYKSLLNELKNSLYSWNALFFNYRMTNTYQISGYSFNKNIKQCATSHHFKPKLKTSLVDKYNWILHVFYIQGQLSCQVLFVCCVRDRFIYVMWSEKTRHMVQNWYFELLISF